MNTHRYANTSLEVLYCWYIATGAMACYLMLLQREIASYKLRWRPPSRPIYKVARSVKLRHPGAQMNHGCFVCEWRIENDGCGAERRQNRHKSRARSHRVSDERATCVAMQAKWGREPSTGNGRQARGVTTTSRRKRQQTAQSTLSGRGSLPQPGKGSV